MKLEALDHPKTLDFAARLNVELPTAIGHLELLWAFTGKKSPCGNIGKWPDGAIARACYWNGDPSIFVCALLEAGFIDTNPEHRYIVHDWHEHAFGWVRAKLKKTGQVFLTQSLERSSERSREQSLDASQGSQVKSRQDKTKTQGADAPRVPGLNVQAWEKWLDYRKQIRKPLKPVSMPAAQRKLAAFGSDQEAVVDEAIANGWHGFFPLKTGGGNAAHQPSRAKRVSDTLDAIAREDAERNGIPDNVG